MFVIDFVLNCTTLLRDFVRFFVKVSFVTITYEVNRNIEFINDFVENDLRKSLRGQSNQVNFVDYNDIILRSYTNEIIFIICVTCFNADRRAFVFLLLMFTPVVSSSWT